MSKEDRRNKRRKKRRFRIILVALVIIYLIFRVIPTLYATGYKTYTVENGYIEITQKVEGIIARSEKVYRAEEQGKIMFFKEEGQKIGIGVKVAQVCTNNNSDELNEELKEIENKITILEDNNFSKEMFKEDLQKNGDKIDNIISQVQDLIIKGEYKRIKKLKDELNIRLDRQCNISGQNSFIEHSLEKLNARKEEILLQMEELNKTYYSDKTGIISYHIDGLEEIFSADNILKFKPDDFKIIEKNLINLKNIESVKPGDPIFKICDNYCWFVVTKMNNEGLNYFKEGNDVYIRFNNYGGEEFKSKIYKIVESKTESLVIFQFDEYLYKFINDRYVNMEIILKKYEGLKILKNSIIEKDGIKGVYIKDVSGIVRFRPVKIKGENDKFAIVDQGDMVNNGSRGKIDVMIGEKTEKRYTIGLFDKVLINGKRVKEGQILN